MIWFFLVFWVSERGKSSFWLYNLYASWARMIYKYHFFDYWHFEAAKFFHYSFTRANEKILQNNSRSRKLFNCTLTPRCLKSKKVHWSSISNVIIRIFLICLKNEISERYFYKKILKFRSFFSQFIWKKFEIILRIIEFFMQNLKN